MLMNIVTIAIGVMVGFMAASCLMIAVIYNKKVMGWIMNKAMNFSIDMTKELEKKFYEK